jgi:hypothetical protein
MASLYSQLQTIKDSKIFQRDVLIIAYDTLGIHAYTHKQTAFKILATARMSESLFVRVYFESGTS